MVRKFLILSALAALFIPSAGASQRDVTTTTKELMPGVTYTREVDFTPHGPVVLDVVTAPKPDGTVYSLAPELSNGAIKGTQKLTGIEKGLEAGATTVGIDGDYFDKSGPPDGILMRDGILDHQPATGRSSLGIAADGTLSVGQVAFSGTWQGTGPRRKLVLNGPTSSKTTLYTPAYGAATPPELGVVEDVIEPFPPTRAGQPLDGVVTKVVTYGATPIPRDGAVLVARDSVRQSLSKEAPLGQQVEVRLTLTPDWSGLEGALGGGPVIVSGGKAVFAAGESFGAGLLDERSARGAVGQLADGRIVLVTVERTNASYSVGMSNYELAQALVRLGAQTAIGLGSGGGAEMAFDGSLLTRPSTGKEIPVADALVLSYTGVYAAPPSSAVFSPNGDGVADTETLSYRLVRPANVVATLSGPGGASVQIASDAEQPGLHTFTWDGRAGGTPAPEGAWTFDVSATDDRDVTTTAERPFTLDDTLSSLSVVPGPNHGRAAVFQLTREADVVVTLSRRNGVTLKTVLSRTLEAGQQQVTWNGRIDGKPAPRGVYTMHVQATGSIGTSSLAATFSWAPHTHH